MTYYGNGGLLSSYRQSKGRYSSPGPCPSVWSEGARISNDLLLVLVVSFPPERGLRFVSLCAPEIEAVVGARQLYFDHCVLIIVMSWAWIGPSNCSNLNPICYGYCLSSARHPFSNLSTADKSTVFIRRRRLWYTHVVVDSPRQVWNTEILVSSCHYERLLEGIHFMCLSKSSPDRPRQFLILRFFYMVKCPHQREFCTEDEVQLLQLTSNRPSREFNLWRVYVVLNYRTRIYRWKIRNFTFSPKAIVLIFGDFEPVPSSLVLSAQHLVSSFATHSHPH